MRLCILSDRKEVYMILLNALVNEIIIEAAKFVFLAAVIVCAVVLGKNLRNMTDAKKSSEKTEQ